eukprot:3252424-Rhodomonas_salina.6
MTSGDACLGMSWCRSSVCAGASTASRSLAPESTWTSTRAPPIPMLLSTQTIPVRFCSFSVTLRVLADLAFTWCVRAGMTSAASASRMAACLSSPASLRVSQPPETLLSMLPRKSEKHLSVGRGQGPSGSSSRLARRRASGSVSPSAFGSMLRQTGTSQQVPTPFPEIKH